MKVIKINDRGPRVRLLMRLLSATGYYKGNISDDDNECLYDDTLRNAVFGFQKAEGLGADGIAGYNTMERLVENTGTHTGSPKAEDFRMMGFLLECEPEAIMAVKKVETGAMGGFFAPGKPSILFEGHIFWSQLEKRGYKPEDILKRNPDCSDILYPKWTKSHYKGGIREYDRLERAIAIDRDAALCSASWGMFQIMGFNHTVCGKKTVAGFVEAMKKSELCQMLLFCRFIRSNSHLITALQASSPNWATFARHYNGPLYAENNYDNKLKEAYGGYKSGTLTI